MIGFVLLGVFFGTALLVLSAYGFINRRRLAAAAELRSRLGDAAPVAEPLNILRQTRRSSVALLDDLLERMSMSSAMTSALEAPSSILVHRPEPTRAISAT